MIKRVRKNYRVLQLAIVACCFKKPAGRIAGSAPKVVCRNYVV